MLSMNHNLSVNSNSSMWTFNTEHSTQFHCHRLVVVAERVKELRERKALKEKKLREKEEKKRQRKQTERDMYKWLDEWSPVVPTAAVGADDMYVNNANNINNAAAAAAVASLAQHLQRSAVTPGFRTRRPPQRERSQRYGRVQSSNHRAPASPRMRSRLRDDDDDVVSRRHGRRHRDDDRRHQGRLRQRQRSSSSSSSSRVDSDRRKRHARRHHSTMSNHSRRRRSTRTSKWHWR